MSSQETVQPSPTERIDRRNAIRRLFLQGLSASAIFSTVGASTLSNAQAQGLQVGSDAFRDQVIAETDVLVSFISDIRVQRYLQDIQGASADDAEAITEDFARNRVPELAALHDPAHLLRVTTRVFENEPGALEARDLGTFTLSQRDPAVDAVTICASIGVGMVVNGCITVGT
jgi:hypothetical protein